MGSFSMISGRASGSGDVDCHNTFHIPSETDLLPPLDALKVGEPDDDDDDDDDDNDNDNNVPTHISSYLRPTLNIGFLPSHV